MLFQKLIWKYALSILKTIWQLDLLCNVIEQYAPTLYKSIKRLGYIDTVLEIFIFLNQIFPFSSIVENFSKSTRHFQKLQITSQLPLSKLQCRPKLQNMPFLIQDLNGLFSL